MVTVYADATIAFPILALYVLSCQKSRKPKRLYKRIGDMYDRLSRDYFDNPVHKKPPGRQPDKS